LGHLGHGALVAQSRKEENMKKVLGLWFTGMMLVFLMGAIPLEAKTIKMST